jgi:threonine/homoserine/homoserine lactone efflux protein
MSKRVLAGLITGLGAVVGDAFMASVGIFGIKIISDFIIEYQTIIRVIGSIILLYMGVNMINSKQDINTRKKDTALTYIEYFISSLVIAVTNPLSLATFILVFAGIGPRLTNGGNYFGVSILMGVILGCCLWWLFLTSIANMFGHLIKDEHFSTINKFLGAIVFILGIAILGGLIFKLV